MNFSKSDLSVQKGVGKRRQPHYEEVGAGLRCPFLCPRQRRKGAALSPQHALSKRNIVFANEVRERRPNVVLL